MYPYKYTFNKFGTSIYVKRLAHTVISKIYTMGKDDLRNISILKFVDM